jgi:hypothetical protein
LLGLALPAFAQYAGPAILSRGEAPSATQSPELSFRPYVEVTGLYDTGLAGVGGANQQGQLGNLAAEGVMLTGGINGSHSWRHTKVGLDYQGSLRHYTQKTYYDGSDQSLMLGVVTQPTRHTLLSLRETAGLFSRSFGLIGLPQALPFDPSRSYIPTTDFFDNRTMYLSTQADFTLQKSTRLSFNVGGDGFLVRRRSTALAGVTGASARGDVQYRLSRRSTAGVNYSYTRFDFNHVFGATDLHTLTLSYAIRISRTLELGAEAGAVRAEMKFIQTVPVDPLITQLLGITQGIQVANPTNYLPTMQARLTKSIAHGAFYVTAGRMMTPGNGLFLTSSMITVSGGYTYTGLRRWSMGANVGYQTGRSLLNISGTYGGTSGGFTVSRQLARSFHGIASVNARKYNSATFSNYNRVIHEARIGFGFAPGDVPLRVW